MIKKLIKTSLVLVAAGAFTMPAFTQEFTSSLSGAVRVDWDMDNRKYSEDASGDQSKDSASHQSVETGDSFIDYKAAYKNEEAGLEASATLRFKANGTKRIIFEGKTTAGDWTGTGHGEWEENWNGDSDAVSSQRHQWVKLNNDLMFAKFGHTQYVANHWKGGDNTFNAYFDEGENGSVGGNGDDLGRRQDTRFTALQAGVDMADLGLNASVLYSATTSGYVLPSTRSYYATASTTTASFDNTTDAGADSTIYGLIVNYENPDLVGLDVTLEYLNGEAKINKERNNFASFDGTKSTGSYLALGVGVNPVEELGIGLMYSKQEVKDSTEYTDPSGDKYTAERTGGVNDITDIFITLDYSLGDLGGLSLVYGTYEYGKYKVTNFSGDVSEDTDATKGSQFELGYSNTVAGVDLTVAYIQATYDGDASAVGSSNSDGLVNGGRYGKSGSADRLKIRAEYAF